MIQTEKEKTHKSVVVFVPVKTLPKSVRKVLQILGYHRNDIGVEVVDRTKLSYHAYGEGYQAVSTVVDMVSGEYKSVWGSWGGENNFTRKAVDIDENEYKIPHNMAVLVGQRGGGKPMSLSMLINASNAARILTCKEEISDRERSVLRWWISYTSAYRRELIETNGWAPNVIEALITKGLLAKAKNGAVRITIDGKNCVRVCD